VLQEASGTVDSRANEGTNSGSKNLGSWCGNNDRSIIPMKTVAASSASVCSQLVRRLAKDAAVEKTLW
jgi:hypothetical protein